MATLAELMVRVGADTGDLESGLGKATDFVDRNFTKISLAGVAAGAGLEAFAQKQAPLTESTRRLAASTGTSEAAMRDLATETSNVTFPLEDVLGLMETGRAQGITSADALQEYATFWDVVGDATGESATELGKAGAALRAVGIEAGNEKEAMSALGFVHQETSGTVSEFLNFLDRTGPELREVGADVDDAAAIMGVLEHELGMTGRTARSEFRQALNESDGTLEGVLNTLGVSEEQFSSYREQVDQSSDVIQRNADIHAESFTPIEKLSHAAEELMFKYGGLAQAAGTLAVPLLALGPIAKGLSMALKLMAGSAARSAVRTSAAWVAAAARTIASLVATAAAFVAQGARMAASMAVTAARVVAGWVLMGVQSLIQAARVALAWIIAMGPIAIVIAAVIGLVALIIANWDKIKAVITAGWDFVKKKTIQVWNAVKAFLSGLWKSINSLVTSAVNAVRSRVSSAWNAIRSTATRTWNAITSALRNAWNRIRSAVSSGISRVMSLVRSLPRRIRNALGNLGRLLYNAGRNILQGLINGIKSMLGAVRDAASNVVSAVRDMLPFSPAKEGPLSGRGSPLLAGRSIAEMLASGMTGGTSTVAHAAANMAAAAGLAAGVPGVGTPSGVRRAGGQPTVVEFRSDGTRVGNLIVELVRRSVRTRGGDVQLVLGGS